MWSIAGGKKAARPRICIGLDDNCIIASMRGGAPRSCKNKPANETLDSAEHLVEERAGLDGLLRRRYRLSVGTGGAHQSPRLPG
jgi:hypothetical protein